MKDVEKMLKVVDDNLEILNGINEDKSRNENIFSYWYPKIKGCGIPTPNTIFYDIPKEITHNLYEEKMSEYTKGIIQFMESHNIIENMHKNQIYLPFIKNATFSNKFDATTSMPLPDELSMALAFTNINYTALLFGADGVDELVIRERIRHNCKKTPCIYNGLPLRTEFRLFYDFDNHKVLYIVNYWDYDYCYNNLHDITDKIIFDSQKEHIEKEFNEYKDKVINLSCDKLKHVTELKGKWSIDFMLDDNKNLWLIDMAKAEHSAYWRQQS